MTPEIGEILEVMRYAREHNWPDKVLAKRIVDIMWYYRSTSKLKGMK